MIRYDIVSTNQKRYFIVVLILFNGIIISCYIKKTTFAYTIIILLFMDLKVKDLIKQKGMTMQQFAEMLGVTRDTLTRNINGNPTLETLERIANTLEVDITELFVRNTPDSEVNGYVKIKGTLYEVHSFEDLRKLLELNV